METATFTFSRMQTLKMLDDSAEDEEVEEVEVEESSNELSDEFLENLLQSVDE